MLLKKTVKLMVVLVLLFIYTPVFALLSSWITVNPNVINENQKYTITMSVSNTGGTTALNTVPSALSGAIGALFSSVQPVSADIPAGGYQEFTWVYQAGAGAAGLSLITGDASSGADTSSDVTSGNTNMIQAKTYPSLSQDIILFPAVVSVGQNITIIMNVTNSGGSVAEGVEPSSLIKVGTGNFSSMTGPAPASENILAGAISQFTWICTASAAGVLSFNSNVTGYAQYSKVTRTSVPTTGNLIIIQTAASLTCGINTYPAQADLGQYITVVMTVTNSGMATAAGVTPSALTESGSGGAVYISGSTPGWANIPGSGSASFTWVYMAAGTGTVDFQGSASGNDVNSWFVVSSGICAGNDVIIQTPASLICGIDVIPPQADVGQSITVVMTVSNSGMATADNVCTMTSAFGTGGVTLVSVPVCAAIQGGTNASFTWTYIATSAGNTIFTGSAQGIDDNTGIIVLSGICASASALIQTPANLICEIASFPNPVGLNGMITVVMTVTNTGQASAINVAPSNPSTSGSGSAIRITGPVPPSATINGGSAAHFTWTYSAVGTGFVAFSSHATGMDMNSGLPISTGSCVSINQAILATADLACSLIAYPDPVTVGGLITVVMTVTNTGLGAATLVHPNPLGISGTASGVYVFGPLPSGAMNMPALTSVSFTWVFTAASPGYLCFSGFAQGIDAATAMTVTSNVSFTCLLVTIADTPTNTPTIQPTFTLTSTPTNTPAVTLTWTVACCGTATFTPTQTASSTPGSPPSKCFITKWGNWGTGDGEFESPSGIAVDSSGNIYVVDYNNSRIQKFTSTGAYITQFGSYGAGDGQFIQPIGIAVDGTGNVYVADSLNDRIQKFNGTGAYITQWGSNGSGNGQFIMPSALSVDSSGNVYVVDHGNNRIQKFNSTGIYITQWGTPGSGNGEFNFIIFEGIAVDGGGDVYIADDGNNRIQKFNSTGTYITQWGGVIGCGNGEFSSPQGVAVDIAGNVYVVDMGNNRVQEFTGTGIYIAQWGASGCASGSADGQFYEPCGAVVDSGGNVYVVDSGNNRVQKFGDCGTPTPTMSETAPVTFTATETLTDTPVLPTPTASAISSATPCYITMWGSSGSGDGQFDLPLGIDTDGGNVYVVDSSNYRIQVFSDTGTYITQWGSLGTGIGQFKDPTGIAIDGSGNVYISDCVNHRIQKFSGTGAYITQWGGFGSGPGQFNMPYDLAIDGGGNVYVADYVNQRIQKFNSAGTYLTQWGILGAGDGQFNNPMGVAVDSSGNVYVGDTGNNRIQVFSGTGAYITQWGGPGTGNGQFNQPIGMDFDASGNIYISDTANNRIQEFTSTGTYITQWGSFGTGTGQFKNPTFIAIDNSGSFYVSEYFNHRVQKFGNCGTPTPTMSETAPVTFTVTETLTNTPTLQPTATNSPTLTLTNTPTIRPSETYTPTLTPTNTLTVQPSSTYTPTPPASTYTFTVETPGPSNTVTPTPSITPTPAGSPADLTIDKSATGDQPAVGAGVTFKITLHNDTPQDVTDLVIWDTLPVQMVYTGYSAATVPVVSGNYVSFTFPLVPANSVVYVYITAMLMDFAEGYPIANRAWCDYNDAYYMAPSRHPAICSTTAFYPANAPVVYPNPFNPSGGSLKIDNLVAGSLVQFYTLTAELVYTINSSNMTETWAGKNMYGDRVSPGIYYYVIIAPDDHKYTGKVFVIH